MKKNKKIKNLVKKIINDIFLSGKLNEKKAQGYLKLFKKLPNHEALGILKEFERQLKRKMAETTLTIESAVKLSPAEVKKITNKMKKDYVINQENSIINESLLGGLRIKVGDNVFDDSVQVKINEVGKVIAS